MKYEEMFEGIKRDINSKFFFFQADDLVLYKDLYQVDFVGIDAVLENRHVPHCCIKVGDEEIFDVTADELLDLIGKNIEEFGYSPPTMVPT